MPDFLCYEAIMLEASSSQRAMLWGGLQYSHLLLSGFPTNVRLPRV